MVVFEDIEDVIEWLEPLDYLAFWDAVAPYRLALQDRDHCDDLIAKGTVEPELVLEVLKYMAHSELAQAFSLKHRIREPQAAQYLRSVH